MVMSSNQSNNAFRASKEISVCLPQHICCKRFLNFRTGWLSVEKRAVTGMWEAPAATVLPWWPAYCVVQSWKLRTTLYKNWTTNTLKKIVATHLTSRFRWPLQSVNFLNPKCLAKTNSRVVCSFRTRNCLSNFNALNLETRPLCEFF